MSRQIQQQQERKQAEIVKIYDTLIYRDTIKVWSIGDTIVKEYVRDRYWKQTDTLRIYDTIREKEIEKVREQVGKGRDRTSKIWLAIVGIGTICSYLIIRKMKKG